LSTIKESRKHGFMSSQTQMLIMIWSYKFCKIKIKEMKKSGKCTGYISTTLLLAHDIDKRIKTEYYVEKLH